MAPPTRVRARVQPWALCEEAMEGFYDAFDHPYELIVHRKRDGALGHKVAYGRRSVAETKRKCHRGALSGAFQREGDIAWGLPRWLGSTGDVELALKPSVAKVGGGERLDGHVGQRQLSS